MIDLPMHSRYSEDGKFTPAELIEQFRIWQIRIWSNRRPLSWKSVLTTILTELRNALGVHP